MVSAFTPFVFLSLIFGGSGFFTSSNGVGFVTQGLANQLSVEYGAKVTSVEERGDEVVVTWSRAGESEHTEIAAATVLAVPPPHLLPIYQQFDAGQREFLSNVQYAKSIHVAFGLDGPTAESSVLLQVPRVSHPDVIGFTFEHNLAAQRVPAGKGLVMAHLRSSWSVDNWEMEDAEVIKYVLAGSRRLGVLPELENNVMTYVCRADPCVVLRRPGDYRAIARFAPGMHSMKRVQLASGEYLGHSSTNGSVISGETAARRIATLLG